MLQKIVLVEDEAAARLGFKNMIDWGSGLYELAGEAENGRDALAVIDQTHADIVITDINMPHMNGIELIRHYSNAIDSPDFLVLSGYDEYQYVREALTLGAFDYLLKLDTTTFSLMEALERVAQVRIRKQKKTSKAHHAYEQLKKNIGLMRKDFMTNVITGYPYSTEEYRVQKELLELCLNPKSIYCAAIKTGEIYKYEEEAYEELSILNQSVLNIAHEMIEAEFYGYCFSAKTGEYLIFASPRNIDDNVGGAFEKTVGRLLEMLHFYLNLTAKAGIGSSLDVGSQAANEIAALTQAYKHAVAAIAQRFFSKNDVILWENVDISLLTKNSHPALLHKKLLFSALDFQRSEQIEQFFTQLTRDFEAVHLSPPDVRSALLDVNYMLWEYSEMNQLNIHELIPNSYRTPQDILNIPDMAQSRAWMDLVQEDLIYALQNNRNLEYSRIVSTAQGYIDEHFDQDISLGLIASMVGLNPSYLSTLFKRYTQTSFVEYLNEVRIKNAKELLQNSALKVYEVAQKCGYRDPYYFNRIFKKITGKSPGEHKKINN